MTDATLHYFTAPWCMPCKQVSPIVEAAAREIGISLLRHDIDTDEGANIAHTIGLTSVPTVMLEVPAATVKLSTPRSKAGLVNEVSTAIAMHA